MPPGKKQIWSGIKKKNLINIAKHGIGFEEAALIFENEHFTITDKRKDYGEIRKISIGSIKDIVIVVVIHTNRRNVIRIISARKANKEERGKYNEYFKN